MGSQNLTPFPPSPSLVQYPGEKYFEEEK